MGGDNANEFVSRDYRKRLDAPITSLPNDGPINRKVGVALGIRYDDRLPHHKSATTATCVGSGYISKGVQEIRVKSPLAHNLKRAPILPINLEIAEI